MASTRKLANTQMMNRQSAIIRQLRSRPENRTCSECKRRGPDWASVNLGVFFCIRCSGFHRRMGTSISQVRSTDLDAWTAEQLDNVSRLGNSIAAQIWEATMSESERPSQDASDE